MRTSSPAAVQLIPALHRWHSLVVRPNTEALLGPARLSRSGTEKVPAMQRHSEGRVAPWPRVPDRGGHLPQGGGVRGLGWHSCAFALARHVARAKSCDSRHLPRRCGFGTAAPLTARNLPGLSSPRSHSRCSEGTRSPVPRCRCVPQDKRSTPHSMRGRTDSTTCQRGRPDPRSSRVDRRGLPGTLWASWYR